MLKPFTSMERKRLLGVAKAVSKIPEIDSAGVAETMKQVVDAHSDRAVREMMEAIEQEEDVTQERVWKLVQQFGLVDARRVLSIIQARLSTIRKLQTAVRDRTREVPDLHNVVVDDPWLLDPRWNLLDDEIRIETLGIEYAPQFDEEGLRLDFLFALAPHPPAPLDEVIVVEIKRGSDSRGRERKATDSEVHKFHQYVLAVQDHYARNTERVTVRGLMIAQAYTPNGDRVRRSLEQNRDVQMHFRTWDRVIDDTERMHTGWLEVSKDRVLSGFAAAQGS